eukprot:scaffold99761_cov69-Phaeocystis_antarctica.AAC.2
MPRVESPRVVDEGDEQMDVRARGAQLHLVEVEQRARERRADVALRGHDLEVRRRHEGRIRDDRGCGQVAPDGLGLEDLIAEIGRERDLDLAVREAREVARQQRGLHHARGLVLGRAQACEDLASEGVARADFVCPLG